MTLHALQGSRPYSTFSLRPPLPRGKPVDADAHDAISRGREEESSAESMPVPSAGRTSLPLRRPPISFLFRMYIACHILRLGTETKFTALVLLHRYVQAKQTAAAATSTTDTEEEEDWPWIGALCLFLACKAEDEPRRLRDIINMAQMVLSSSLSDTNVANTIGNDRESVLAMNMMNAPALDGAYWESKKKAIETEQMVLRWLGFDCSVSHPHRAVFWILEQSMNRLGTIDAGQEQQPSPPRSSSPMPKKQKIDDTRSNSMGKSDCDNNTNDIRNELRSLSFRILNDALFFPRALHWGVVEMACAAIDLALVDAFEQVADGSAVDGTAATVAKDTCNDVGSLKSIFKHGWWTRYEVSNKDFEDCRNNLKEATCYLKTMATAEK